MLSDTLKAFYDVYSKNGFKPNLFKDELLNEYKEEISSFLKNHISYNNLELSVVEDRVSIILYLDNGLLLYLDFDLIKGFYISSIDVKEKIERNYFYEYLRNNFIKKDSSYDKNRIVLKQMDALNMHDISIRTNLKPVCDLVEQILNSLKSSKYYEDRVYYMLLESLKSSPNYNLKDFDGSDSYEFINSYECYLKEFLNNAVPYIKINFDRIDDDLIYIVDLLNDFKIYFYFNFKLQRFKIYFGLENKFNAKFFSYYIQKFFKKYCKSEEENRIMISNIEIKNLDYLEFKNNLNQNIGNILDINNSYQSERYSNLKIFFEISELLKEFSDNYLRNSIKVKSRNNNLLKKYKNSLNEYLETYISYEKISFEIINENLITFISLNKDFKVFLEYNFSSKLFKFHCTLKKFNLELFYNYVKNSVKRNNIILEGNKILIDVMEINSDYEDFSYKFIDNINIINRIYNNYLNDSNVLFSNRNDNSHSIGTLWFNKSDIDNIIEKFKNFNCMCLKFDFIIAPKHLDKLKNKFYIKSLLPNKLFNNEKYLSNIQNYFSFKKGDVILIGCENNLYGMGIVKDDLRNYDSVKFIYDVHWVNFNNSTINFKDKFVGISQISTKNFNENIDKFVGISQISVKDFNENIFPIIIKNDLKIKGMFNEKILNEFYEDYDDIYKKYINFIDFFSSKFSKNKIKTLEFPYKRYKNNFINYYSKMGNSYSLYIQSSDFCKDLKKATPKTLPDVVKSIYIRSSILKGYGIKKNIDKLPKTFISHICKTYKKLISNKYSPSKQEKIISGYNNGFKKLWRKKFGHVNIFISILLFYENFNEYSFDFYDKILPSIKFFDEDIYKKINDKYTIYDGLKDIDFNSFNKIDLSDLINFYIFSLWMFDDEYGGYLSNNAKLLPFEILIADDSSINNDSLLVNINPQMLSNLLNDFYISDKILNRICSSLNAGKHIILEGSCGTGKTDLALKFSNCSKKNKFIDGHILTTATSDWSTFDTIGGLIPNEKGVLTFHRGKFLEAIASNKWLIIDEINRADIDKAFGQLFTVLSGYDVELPFKDNGHTITIKLWDNAFSEYDEETATYYIGSNWRIIGTMNVDDKDNLFDLSYAFMRRFMFIEVDVPENAGYETLIRNWAGNLNEFYLTKLFELVYINNYKKIGPAIFKDMIDFMLVRDKLDSSDRNKVLAEAINSYIVPQLEGLSKDKITEIKNFFEEIKISDEIINRLDNLIVSL